MVIDTLQGTAVCVSLTWIRCIYVEFAQVLGALGKVKRVGVGEEYVHVQFKASIRDSLLQRRRKGTGVKGHQHFRATKSKIKNLDINYLCFMEQIEYFPLSFLFIIKTRALYK